MSVGVIGAGVSAAMIRHLSVVAFVGSAWAYLLFAVDGSVGIVGGLPT